MTDPVDLYDSHYGEVEAEVYRAVRAATYDEDLGQTSWISAAECDEFCSWMDLGKDRRILEVACGSGGVTTRIAERLGCRAQGVDINKAAVSAATSRARERGVQDLASFRLIDADKPLPFPDGSFDAVFCNDSINHLRDRGRVLAEWHRVLRPGGRCLYTDPIVVTGCLSNEEIAIRSSIGFFLFMPQCANEAFLRAAGFRVIRVADVTKSVADVSRRWLDARATREGDLLEVEGEDRFRDLQGFLEVVHRLSSQGRLSRFAFLGEKPPAEVSSPPGNQDRGSAEHG